MATFAGHLREPVLSCLHMAKAQVGSFLRDNSIESDLERINYADYLLKTHTPLDRDVESLITAINARFMNNTMPDILKQGIRDTVATTTSPRPRPALPSIAHPLQPITRFKK